jgi:hypothetical protein
MENTVVSMKALAFFVLLMAVENQKEEYAEYNQCKHNQFLIGYRYSNIVVIDIHYPSNTDIMKKHSMTLTKFKGVTCKIQEYKRK